MDWKVLFSRIRFTGTIVMFMTVLVIIGISVVLAGGNNVIFAFFIFLLSAITEYIKSMGLVIFWVYKKYKARNYIFIDSLINIIIMVIFGYKYVSILYCTLWAYISYVILWGIYLIILYLQIIKGMNYYTNRLGDWKKELK